MTKKNKKSTSFQGISAKTIEDISMISDGGIQTATASDYAKRVKMVKRKNVIVEKKKSFWKNPAIIGPTIGGVLGIIAACIKAITGYLPHK